MIERLLCRIALATLVVTLASKASADERPVPGYDHIFVIVEENHTSDQVMGSGKAPTLDRLAAQYGVATNFYAQTHPSEPNYVAMIAGDTLGIRDDDAFDCKPKVTTEGCEDADSDDYVDHTVYTPGFMDQLQQRGLTWKGYFEDIPKAGSLDVRSPLQDTPEPGKPRSLYAAKHNPFLNFKSVRQDPRRAEHIVGFEALEADVAAGKLPNFAFIVPNQCNDMHGLVGAHVPWSCLYINQSRLVERADKRLASLIDMLVKTPAWTGNTNTAIVITFDENDSGSSGDHPEGCCGSGPNDPHNPGGGWIATIVMTNHGPRGLKDPTPYNHYSLLRTMEQAFGISTFIGHAADTNKGVVAMTPLFETKNVR
jgi:phospholipase C